MTDVPERAQSAAMWSRLSYYDENAKRTVSTTKVTKKITKANSRVSSALEELQNKYAYNPANSGLLGESAAAQRYVSTPTEPEVQIEEAPQMQ